MTKRRAAARGDDRRAEVLKTALTLFNASGSGAISTNRIAAELGISVGNLYWHFRDKEAIVRALFEQHHARFDGVWAPPGEGDTLTLAVRAIERTFAIAWEYRFLYRELSVLTRADPELRKIYVAMRERRRDELRAFVVGFEALEILELPTDEAIRTELEENAWLVASFWLPYVDLREGSVTRRAALHGAAALLGLYRPYVRKAHQHAFSATLANIRDHDHSLEK